MNKNLNHHQKTFKNQKVVQYEIVTEPLPDKQYDSLPLSVREQEEDLRDLISHAPHKAIPILLKLMKKYPQIPRFYNFLNVAYANIGETEKSEKIAFELYQKYPDYLFGKTNYALICLRKGETEKILEIFDNKLDLQLLLPSRKKFHLSEYTGFAAVMALYYLDIGRYELAKNYYDTLEKVNPDSQLTQIVKESFLKRETVQFLA